MSKEFVHLHLHTEYSLLDGAAKIKKLIPKVAKLGQKAVAITDHGVMFGVIDFYKECLANDVKPIIGCEVYLSQRTRHDKVKALDGSSYHLVLLCKNNIGYQNLSKLVSLSNIEGFYIKPRIDLELLEKYSEGLICLSACLAGEIPRNLMNGRYEEAKVAAMRYKDIFKDDFYLEIMDHGIEEQKDVIPEILKLSKELDIPIVATNDVHYVEKDDNYMQHVLVCIQTGKSVDDKDGLEFETKEFYLKSYDEMEEIFPYAKEALANTVKVAEKCDVSFEFGVTKLPLFKAPDNRDNIEYFKDLCNKGLVAKYGENPPKEAIDRLSFEMDVIINMGYVDYYLIVFDFINYARQNNIPVGPGRGSGAGSIAAYCVGITGIDPLKYNLLFERFLNPERISMPDFDIDFCYEERQRVIDYVIEKYGADHVAQIITFGTMAARGAIRDVGRALSMPYGYVDTIAKTIPMELNITIEQALRRSNEFKGLYDKDADAKKLIDIAKQLEGFPRHSSTHAAGVVITKDEVSSYLPLSKNDESVVTQFPMGTLEELGLLKMDFLGLRTLTIIKDCSNFIKKHTPNFNIEKIPLDDKAVYDMLSHGKGAGVFQFESGGMRRVLSGLKPESIEDLIAVISLYRPGPMDSIDKYIRNRHNPSEIKYDTEHLKPILDVTYGCIVYQEQVMEIFRKLAGYSLGGADLVRRAMSKKKASVMEREREVFIGGCKENGISKEIANKIFNEMSSFASYAFNKSHAAAYAYLAYQTAYLKCHYTAEFMAAMLTSVMGNADKLIEYKNVCDISGIKILPPDVNKSTLGYNVEGDNIRYGLLGLRNVGRNIVNNIILERNGGEFTSFYNFCERMIDKEINKRAIESLIYSGAFDSMDVTRKTLATNFEDILSSLNSVRKNTIEGQVNFFAMEDTKASFEYRMEYLPEYSQTELFRLEKEAIGTYLSGHPLLQYREYQKQLKTSLIKDILEDGVDNSDVCILASISSVRTKVTRQGSNMAFIALEDLSSSIEVIVFSKVFEQNIKNITENNIILLKGRLSLKEDEDPKIIAENITEIEKAIADSKTLYLKIESAEGEQFCAVREILRENRGVHKVIIYLKDTKSVKAAPQSLYINPSERLFSDLSEILQKDDILFK